MKRKCDLLLDFEGFLGFEEPEKHSRPQNNFHWEGNSVISQTDHKLCSGSEAAQALYTIYRLCTWKIKFELVNDKISCKCRSKLHLPLRTVILVFSVQSEGKLCPF